MAIVLKSYDAATGPTAIVEGTITAGRTRDLSLAEAVAGLTVTVRDGSENVLGQDVTAVDGSWVVETTHFGAVTVEVDGDDLSGLNLGLAAGSDFNPGTKRATASTIAGREVTVSGKVISKPQGGLAINTSPHSFFTVPQPFLNLVWHMKVDILGNGQPAITAEDLEPYLDVTTKLPGEIPAGYDRIRFLNSAMDEQGANSPIWGVYLMRVRNLGPSYTITTDQWASAVNAGDPVNTQDMILRLEPTENNISFTINGPSGPMPAGWYIEIVKTEELDGTPVPNLDNYDGVGLPAGDARRYFIPQFLDAYADWSPHHIRFVKMARTETGDYRTVGDYPTAAAKSWPLGAVPVEVCVALCNHLKCGMWWANWSKADNALIDWVATYVRDNLDPTLEVYLEHGNEIWNNGYKWTRYHAGLGAKRYSTAIAGTVSTTAGSKYITRTSGPGFDTIFSESGQSEITFGDGDDVFTYAIDFTEPPTADTIKIKWQTALYDATNLPYWSSSGPDLYQNHTNAYAWKAVNLAQRWSDIFAAANRRHRLITLMSGQLANTGLTNLRLNPSLWSQDEDYVDPKTVFDAMAFNVYYGSSMFESGGGSAQSTTNKRAMEWLAANGTDQEIIDTYRTVMTGGSVVVNGETVTSPSESAHLPGMAALLKAHRAMCEPHGIRLVAYEGGDHIIHVGVKFETPEQGAAIRGTMMTFKNSPQSQSFYEMWADLWVRFMDGPVMWFNFFETWDIEYFGLLPEYGFAGDSRTAALANYKDRAPWWVPDEPPQAATVPPQTWTVGLNPAFSLADWCSVNTTSFSGTPPAGMTLNSDGSLSGAPAAGTSGTYTFTASNAAGSVDFSVEVSVK